MHAKRYANGFRGESTVRKKAKEKQRRRAKLTQRAQQERLESAWAKHLQGISCVQCQQPITSPVDAAYIVKAKVWQAAGMERWDSGYLHLKCLEQRLGRKLEREDFYAWCVRPDAGARLDPEYAKFLRTKNADHLDDPDWWRSTVSKLRRQEVCLTRPCS